jgi:hypothetical protein
LDAARDFRQMTREEIAALLARTAPIAQKGEYERYKTKTEFDGTAKNPQWLG